MKRIKISETMRVDPMTFNEVEGLWDRKDTIIVKRSTLASISKYAGVLLHEVCHATSGASDITDRFEQELTDVLGGVTGRSLKESR